MKTELATPVGEIVRENFRSARVFTKYDIDFCCGGRQSLAEACEKKGIDPDAVRADLALAMEDANGVPAFDSWGLDALIDHIVGRHHAYIREVNPAITQHAEKVASVHGERHPETIRIARLFAEVRNELEGHMVKEEQILFPYIKRLVAIKMTGKNGTPSPFGTIRNPIAMMEMEHESAGTALAEIRALAANFTLPEDACTTFRTLYRELEDFESDLHTHIHLENNLLHPKAIRIEEELAP